MGRHRYRGVLRSPLQTIDDADAKLPALFADLSVEPKDRDAYKKALLALAERHVPGFRPMKTRRPPGRKSAFAKAKDDVFAECGPQIAALADDVFREDLRKIVDRASRRLRRPGGAKFTKRQLCKKISEAPMLGPFENPYYGVKVSALLAIVSHSGPRSEFQKARQLRRSQMIQKLANHCGK